MSIAIHKSLLAAAALALLPLAAHAAVTPNPLFTDHIVLQQGVSVVVSSPSVKAPVAVRYAWDNFPEGCNLYNAADLQASPFRTDNWKYPLTGLVE